MCVCSCVGVHANCVIAMCSKMGFTSPKCTWPLEHHQALAASPALTQPLSLHSSPPPKSGCSMVAKHVIETSACQKGVCVGSAAASSPWELTAFGAWKGCPAPRCPSIVHSFLCTPELCAALHGHSTFPSLSDSCITSDTAHFSTSSKEHFFSSSICFPSPLLIFMA